MKVQFFKGPQIPDPSYTDVNRLAQSEQLLCPNLKSKRIKYLNMKPMTLKIIEGKVRNSLKHIGTGENAMNMTGSKID
jgi:hypothetical protein